MRVEYKGWDAKELFFDTKFKNKGNGTARVIAFPVMMNGKKAVEIRSELTSQMEGEIHGGVVTTMLVDDMEMLDDLIEQLQKSREIVGEV